MPSGGVTPINQGNQDRRSQPVREESSSEDFRAFGGSGTAIGGNSDNNVVFTNYDHLDKQNQGINEQDETLPDDEMRVDGDDYGKDGTEF